MGDFERLDFTGFDGREEALRETTRFRSKGQEVMFYRTNLLIHGKRVHFLLEDAINEVVLAFPDFDEECAYVIAEVHDDPETIAKTKDVPLIIKLAMTEKEREDYNAEALIAIDQLSSQWPTYVGHISYREAMLAALHKNILEAQVVSFFDKVDAMCEVIHELQAGNRAFLEQFSVYQKELRGFGQKDPHLRELLKSRHPLIAPFTVNPERLTSSSRTSTIFDMYENTSVPMYNRWKELTIEHFNPRVLTEKVE